MSTSTGPTGPVRPTPRPPGSVLPRAPRAPDQRGGDLEPVRTEAEIGRRLFAWGGLTALLTAMGGCTVKFFFPRAIFEPKTTFKIGRPDAFGFGVDDTLQDKFRIWVVRDSERVFVIRAVCTHLGCTPNWVASANKFKCPCHGSGYDSGGVNFEGPAPRPMDRADVRLAPDGQMIVNVDKLYRADKAGEFDNGGRDGGAFLTGV